MLGYADVRGAGMSDVTIKGVTWTPTAPVDFSLAFDIFVLSSQAPARAAAAALVATWRTIELARPDVTYSGSGFSAGQFGGDCFNALVAMGVKPNDILEQGAIALKVLADAVIPAEEVQEREGFTEPESAGENSG